jgi:triacylglycerol esterase/lipase EstA (alpha/beta hydrolase family)
MRAAKGFWAQVGAGVVDAGRAAGKVTLEVSRSLKAAYDAVEPDLRRHAAQLPLVGLTTLLPSPKEVSRLPDDRRRALVFVHGMGGGPGNFAAMRRYLHWHGRRRSYAISLASESSLEAMAERLSRFVEEVVVKNDLAEGERIDLVAHSMGGLVARLALEDPSTRRRVATLVTLGTPHAGTQIARYLQTQSTLSLRPDSPVIARLAGQLPWPGPKAMPRLVSIFSASDLMLLPTRSAHVEGAENVELTRFTHYSYLLHPEGWQRVLVALAYPENAKGES